jgi:hypothetical protein
MARKQKLKVYRTPIGFHDAFVAAPSRKAALAAWGADVDLFARGAADVVTDEDLTREPLEKPGTIVRRLRGTSDEHIAALPEDRPARERRADPPDEDEHPAPRRRRATGKSAARQPSRGQERQPEPAATRPEDEPRKPSAPRPSRARLDAAETRLDQARSEHDKAIADIRQREKELQQERRELERRHGIDVAKLETSLAKARESYGAALETWRM